MSALTRHSTQSKYVQHCCRSNVPETRLCTNYISTVPTQGHLDTSTAPSVPLHNTVSKGTDYNTEWSMLPLFFIHCCSLVLPFSITANDPPTAQHSWRPGVSCGIVTLLRQALRWRHPGTGTHNEPPADDTHADQPPTHVVLSTCTGPAPQWLPRDSAQQMAHTSKRLVASEQFHANWNYLLETSFLGVRVPFAKSSADVTKTATAGDLRQSPHRSHVCSAHDPKCSVSPSPRDQCYRQMET